MRVHHRPCLSPRCRKARQASRPRSCIRLPVETFRTEPSRPEMPIKIPHDLPARETLEREGVLIIRDTDAIRQDRKSVVKGKSVSVRVDLGGRRIIKKQTYEHTHLRIQRNIKL